MFYKRCQQDVKFNFYKQDIMAAVSLELIKLCPGYYEELLKDITTILIKLSDKIDCCKELHKNIFLRSYLYMTRENFITWVKESLMSIPEFFNLNLSYNERKQGINFNDEGRPQVIFCGLSKERTEDSWKDDFIDLQAVLQNIECSFFNVNRTSHDCFLCEHHKEDITENFTVLECLTCKHNPRLTDNYVLLNRPFSDDILRWCLKPCLEGKAICCWDCNQKNSCDNRCCGSYFTDDNITCEGLIRRDV